MSPGIVTVTLNPAIDQTVAIPEFKADTVNRVTWEQSDPGGKGVNVASFLADFGYPCTVTGFLGQDNPELFKKLFQQKHIEDRFVRIAGKTRVNVKIIDEVQQQVTDINFPGQSPFPQDVTQLQIVIEQLMPEHDWFVLSGSIPADVPVTLYRDLILALKQAGKTVVLDTSGDRLKTALVAKPDIIKPNQVEFEEILGYSLQSELEIIQAARQLIQQGLWIVVVSMGAKGALFIDRDQVIHAQPPTITVKSTVGAGDAMVAGAVVGLVEERSLADCARLGAAFSMGALSQFGPSLPPKAAINANATQVRLRKL
ncbi:MAG: 1-phosphofructokinase [Pseudanabaenales cyanobacterium]|nr:1-phosphofructokinase [Pseudanabaenales cyanobacterium]